MLRKELVSNLNGRVVVVGVGDIGRGDDGAGPLVACMLAEAGVKQVIDGGTSPEIHTWRLRELHPDCVLFVDAVDFRGNPGDVALLQPGQLRSTGFDTHRAPLKLTMEYLEQELRCKCYLLAIQPRDVRRIACMCDEVRHSAASVAKMLKPRLARHREN